VFIVAVLPLVCPSDLEVMLVVFVVVGVLPLACAGTETVVFVVVTVVVGAVVATGVTDDELLEPVGLAEPVVAPLFVDGAT
jgi:hypothetical protein